MVRILLGGRNLALRDVVAICAEDAIVQLDENALAKLLPTSPQAKSALPCKRSVSDLVPQASSPQLSPESARALILGVLIRALQPGGRVRPQVAEFLADLLNSGAQQHLRFPVSANAFVTVADVLGGAQAENLETHAAPGLFVHEFEWLQSGDLNGLSGLAALPAFAAFMLLDAADAIAALTCEALPASIEAGAAPLHGNGATHVAANIRTMLKDSKQLIRGEIQRSIARIPVLHGCARDQAAPFERVFAAELNVAGAASAETLAAAMSTLVSVTATLIAASRSRIADLVTIEDGGQAGDREAILAAASASENAAMNASSTCASALPMCISGQKPASETAFKAFEALVASIERARGQLAREAWLALRVIGIREVEARTAFESSEATRKQRMEAAYAKVAAQENVNAKKLKNLEFHPRSFAFVLGTGSSALRGVLAADSSDVQEKQVLAALQPASTNFAELVRQMLIASNEMKKPKPPKGTRDYGKEEMMIRERVFATIRSVFQRHGATALDTPVFELRETLMGKYGEDSKLIYDLADQGGEQLSLRYDLTVPFARYLGTHNVRKLKRYHIARVYRRDNPAMNRGRFREFYQCDFDIAGEYDLMIPDAEVLAVLTEVLDALDLQFKVKFNHRRLLDAIMEICGVPDDKFRTICSAIDKLDKEAWSDVREEMLEKGLNADAADKLGTFVSRNGEPFAMLAELRALPDVAQNTVAMAALDELDVLFAYLDSLRVLPRISFDLSLARGLDYYTGVIYEAVLTDSDQVGSIAAGGRYDDLVGMFSARKVPAVGVSIGIERVFAIVEQRERARAGGIVKTRVQVLVVSAGADLTKERMALCSELWAGGIVSEFVFKKAPKLQKQIDHALELGIPYIALMGESELEKGVVVVKNVKAETQATVAREDILAHLQKCLAEQ